MGFWHRRRKGNRGMSDSPDELNAESGTSEEAARNLDAEKLLRLQADFENFRRRNATARAEAAADARRQMLAGLLSVYDNFLRARDYASAAPAEAVPYLEGFDAIRVQLEQFLREQGLEEIESEPGQHFDPKVHEAAGTVATHDPEAEGTIAEVIRRGYRFKDSVLRPATVLVYARSANEGGETD